MGTGGGIVIHLGRRQDPARSGSLAGCNPSVWILVVDRMDRLVQPERCCMRHAGESVVSTCLIAFAIKMPAGSVALWAGRCDELARKPEAGHVSSAGRR